MSNGFHGRRPHAGLVIVRIAFCFAVVLLAVAPGCRRSGLVQVRGRVTYADGSPLPLGRVLIDAGGKATGAWGRIKSDGRFSIGTLKENDGMAPGTYRVAIVDASTPPGSDGPGKIFVAPKFSDFSTSGLKFRVPEQTTWNITVEPPAAKP
jgi:hypothetical protein